MRAAIYSLGGVGYELLTGETVFCGLSLGEVMLNRFGMHRSPLQPVCKAAGAG